MSVDRAFRSASDLVNAIGDRKLGSAELVEHYVSRIERLDETLNAVVARDFDRARERGRAADTAVARGESWGPLHGLPITIKDSFEVAGMTCTSGSPGLKGHRPERNAESVQKLVDAGAIILGKTNLPLLAGDVQSYNEVYGQTNNPWNPERVPGGSSGGAAAALASGMTALDLGSDIGGSIRNPAHFCGVYGHKASSGIVSMRGHIPPPPGMFAGEYTVSSDLAVAGPLARSARDLDRALRLIAGPSSAQSAAWDLTLPPPRRSSLGQYRVGLWLDDPQFPVDARVRDLLESAVQRLSACGARVEDRRPAIEFSRSHEIFQLLLRSVMSPGLPQDQFDRTSSDAVELAADARGARACSLRGITLLHRDWLRLDFERMQLRQAWADFFEDFDVLLCPVFPVTAFAHDHSEDRFARTLRVNGIERCYVDTSIAWNGLASVSYLPSTVAPVGLADDGLPVGIQIIAPFLEDRTSIHFAELMEDVIGGFVVPPALE